MRGFSLIEAMMVVLFVGLVGLAIENLYRGSHVYERYMGDCMKEHKEYECRIMLHEVRR